MSLKVNGKPPRLGDSFFASSDPANCQGAFHSTARPSPTSEDEAARERVRRLTVLLQRNAKHDGESDRVRYEGYRTCWPNGQELSVGVQRFCQQGCRLLLGRKARNGDAHLVELGVHPVDGLEAPLTQVGQGMRCRRFYLDHESGRARMFFFNGSPTDVEFDLERDEPVVIRWLGLDQVKDGDRLWFDLSARSLASAGN